MFHPSDQSSYYFTQPHDLPFKKWGDFPLFPLLNHHHHLGVKISWVLWWDPLTHSVWAPGQVFDLAGRTRPSSTWGVERVVEPGGWIGFVGITIPDGCFLKWWYPPKMDGLYGKPYQNGWFGGTIILGNPHMLEGFIPWPSSLGVKWLLKKGVNLRFFLGRCWYSLAGFWNGYFRKFPQFQLYPFIMVHRCPGFITDSKVSRFQMVSACMSLILRESPFRKKLYRYIYRLNWWIDHDHFVNNQLWCHKQQALTG